ncbi:MAG TPA: methyltransferase domain-containing protein [Opitutales bacterium]|nr:methyltransferase domain-containing protein [Opitutales bacterium]
MNEVVEKFDRSVEGYEANCAPQEALAAELARWVPYEERSGFAIEFGAGTGLFTRKMQPWCGPYLATDASAQMVATGIRLCPIVAWLQHDAQNAQSLGPADWVFACNLLQWLDNPAEILSGWRDLLKPGGHLVIAVLLEGTFGELQQILPEANPLTWRSAGAWSSLVTQAGFAIERAEIWQHLEIYPSSLDFLRSVHAMGLAPRHLVGPGRLRTALRKYDGQYAIAGGVRSTWRGWLARAAAD